MKKIILLTIFPFILFFSCKEEPESNLKSYKNISITENVDSLYLHSSDTVLKFGAPCCFLNAKGDTIIPLGKYEIFAPENMLHFTFVKSKHGIVGIDRKGNVLYDAYLYGDFILDTFNEGLCRVIRNNKIGYINKQGEVVIPCQFNCAEIFMNGKAKVSQHCNTEKDPNERPVPTLINPYFINHKGEKFEETIP